MIKHDANALLSADTFPVDCFEVRHLVIVHVPVFCCGGSEDFTTFSFWIECAQVDLHLEYVLSVFCGLAVEHPSHVSFRLTEVQLPVTARLARAYCTVEQVLHEMLLRFKLSWLGNDLIGLFNANHRSTTKLTECCDSIP